MGKCGEGGPGWGLEGSVSARLCPGPIMEVTVGGQGHVEQRWTEPSGPSQEGRVVPHRTRQEILEVSAQNCTICLFIHVCARTHTHIAMSWLCSDQLWANDLCTSVPICTVGHSGTANSAYLTAMLQEFEGCKPSSAQSTGLWSGMSNQVLLSTVFTRC